MAARRQSSNVVALFAILVGSLALAGLLLLSPSEFHLTCHKDSCRYTASAVLGSKTAYQFSTNAVSDVSIHETHSKSGTTYHVYLKEADHQLELSKFSHHRDADALLDRMKQFLKTPTDIPLDVYYNNKPGMLLGVGIASLAVLLGLFFSGRKGKSPIKISIKTNVQVKQRQRQL